MEPLRRAKRALLRFDQDGRGLRDHGRGANQTDASSRSKDKDKPQAQAKAKALASGRQPAFALAFFASVAAFVLGTACQSGCASQNHNPPTKAAPAPSSLPQVVIHPTDPSRSAVYVSVEVARTDEERAYGLMNREKLASGAGMLFLFDREEPRSFWMKNTYISLDMIFIKANKQVLGVVERTEPLSTTPRNVPGASKYVLEVPAGYAQANGIGPNTTVEFMNVE